jgi:hypothetical protein
MAHTDYRNPQLPQHESNDWIELYNTTPASINLNHWYLSDDIGEPKKWAIPAVEIAGHSYISFDEVTGFHNPINSGFGLNKAGEDVILSYLPGTSEDRIVDSVRFKGQLIDTSIGRYPDGDAYWLQMAPSRDLSNDNPALNVMIDELMYHPANQTDAEYIELYNPTASRIYLENSEGAWRLRRRMASGWWRRLHIQRQYFNPEPRQVDSRGIRSLRRGWFAGCLYRRI